jgi:Tfp pilus assembly PilM family ATPase
MNWPWLASRTPIGIDIGRHSVRAAQLSRCARGWRVECAASLPRHAPDEPLDAAEVRRLVGVLRRQGFTGTSAVLAVPADGLLSALLELPPVESAAPLEQMARMELARSRDLEPRSFEMVYWSLPASVSQKARRRVLVVACTHERADALLEPVQQTGLEVQVLDARWRAVARACAPLLDASTGIAGILDLDWDCPQLLVLYRGVIVYERSLGEIAIGKLAELLRTRYELEPRAVRLLLAKVGVAAPSSPGSARAELGRSERSPGPPRQARPMGANPGCAGAKPGAGSGLFDAVRAAITKHFADALEDLRAPFSYATQQYPDAPLEQLVLVGDGTSISGLSEYLADALGVATRGVCPADLAKCAPPLLSACGRGELMGAFGLAQSPS